MRIRSPWRINKKIIAVNVLLLFVGITICTLFFWKWDNFLPFLTYSNSDAGYRDTNIFPNEEEFRKLPAKEQLRLMEEMGVKEGHEAVRVFIKRTYPGDPSDEHELYHVVGASAFLQFGYSAFGVCDSAFSFACYHGVILEAIKKNGYTDDVLKDAAQGCLSLGKNRTAITACIHGIGHAIMWVELYDLMSSYRACDRMFDDELDLFFCYDGVSMENVVRRGEQKGSVNQLESDDPYYPCNTIPSKYQPACVREHLHHVRRIFYGKDTKKVQEYCLHFEGTLTRSECFGALGNAISQDNFDKPGIVIEECDKLPHEYRAFCIGVAATQYSFSKQFETAKMLCEALPTGGEREGCTSSITYARSTLF